MKVLFVKMASTIQSATCWASITGNNQAKRVVKVWNIPVDMQLGQTVVK
jgi:hypothetical protein